MSSCDGDDDDDDDDDDYDGDDGDGGDDGDVDDEDGKRLLAMALHLHLRDARLDSPLRGPEAPRGFGGRLWLRARPLLAGPGRTRSPRLQYPFIKEYPLSYSRIPNMI